MGACVYGTIFALRAPRTKREDIAKQVRKKVSKQPGHRAVDAALVILEEFCRGGDVPRAGADPRAPNQKQQQQLRQIVVAERGKAKVTTSYRWRCWYVLAGSWKGHCLALASKSRLRLHEASPEDPHAAGRVVFASA